MNEHESLLRALETICQDSLESSVEQVRQMDDDGEITTAMRALIRAADALEAISQQQPKTLETLRSHGIVFDGPLGNDPKNWQIVAFSIYTDLCEVDMWARAALESDE